MDDKQFEQDYKKMHTQHVPDLWDRIEAGLEEEPDRKIAVWEEKPLPLRRSGIYGLAAVASFIILIGGFAVSKQLSKAVLRSGEPDMMMAEAIETEAYKTTEPAGAMAAGAAEENGTSGELRVADADEAAVSDAAGAPGAPAAAEQMPDTVLMSVNNLQIPDNARTVEADASYFSEAVLAETDLLCEATIDSVSFGYDDSGSADHVVYEVSMGEIHYAAGYVTGGESVVVTSPIVRADADEAYLLYQMKPGNTYLLPLKETADSWELIYPFAPQIQLTAERGYVFHSGFTSLVNEQTLVTKGVQEGANDFYYDRMLSRQDDTFLSDLITLVENNVQGRK